METCYYCNRYFENGIYPNGPESFPTLFDDFLFCSRRCLLTWKNNGGLELLNTRLREQLEEDKKTKEVKLQFDKAVDAARNSRERQHKHMDNFCNFLQAYHIVTTENPANKDNLVWINRLLEQYDLRSFKNWGIEKIISMYNWEVEIYYTKAGMYCSLEDVGRYTKWINGEFINEHTFVNIPNLETPANKSISQLMQNILSKMKDVLNKKS